MERLSTLCYGLPGARWVPEDQFHLTLRFIGEVDGGVFADIREGLSDVRADCFSFGLDGLGYFPPRKKPRVLWAGVKPDAGVCALRDKVESVLVRLGLEPEKRKFAPHVTLARLRDTPIRKLTRFLEGNALFSTEQFSVRQFHLYSSVLTPNGAIHQLEESYSLKS